MAARWFSLILIAIIRYLFSLVLIADCSGPLEDDKEPLRPSLLASMQQRAKSKISEANFRPKVVFLLLLLLLLFFSLCWYTMLFLLSCREFIWCGSLIGSTSTAAVYPLGVCFIIPFPICQRLCFRIGSFPCHSTLACRRMLSIYLSRR